MTERLYYSDSYTHTFNARIIERLTHSNHPALILDKTFFYPTSGGQPNDLGSINQAQVIDVIARESDHAILHIVDRETDSGDAACSIEWSRRFDFMQQHTGQHILSQAFIRIARAETASFHLGDSLTIDLAVEKLSPDFIDQAEDLANRIVTDNAPIRSWFPSDDELQKIPLRKAPEIDGRLRIVAIGEFDFTACGGTHVAHTGEVGLIKIIKVERAKKAMRVEFMCGKRALRDYRRKNAIVNQLAVDFTCGVLEVEQSIDKLRSENQTRSKELKELRLRGLEEEAQKIIAALPDTWGNRVAKRVWANREMDELRKLAMRLTDEPKVIVLLGSSGAKANLVFARSADVDQDMKALLMPALKVIGSEKGGGDSRLAQGGGVPASEELIEKALQEAKKNL
ncbi:MAG: metal-dependent hydrolase [Chloroflexi bacterium]|nr:metal-dependent hydrolase [Chloroflexota bacterium]